MVQINEILSIQQRRKRKVAMRRIKHRIARGRRIAQKKMANPAKLKTRAQRSARNMIRKRVAGSRGGKYRDLSPAARMQVDKQVNRRKGLVKKVSKRMMPKVRKAERERLKSYRAKKNEDFNSLSDVLNRLERKVISEKVLKNLEKKAIRHGVWIDDLKEAYIRLSVDYSERETFDKLNTALARRET